MERILRRTSSLLMHAQDLRVLLHPVQNPSRRLRRNQILELAHTEDLVAAADSVRQSFAHDAGVNFCEAKVHDIVLVATGIGESRDRMRDADLLHHARSGTDEVDECVQGWWVKIPFTNVEHRLEPKDAGEFAAELSADFEELLAGKSQRAVKATAAHLRAAYDDGGLRLQSQAHDAVAQFAWDAAEKA